MLTAAVVIVWAATAYRAVLSWTQPRLLWRTAFTLALLTDAIALTIYRFRIEIDQAFALFNVASLSSRLVETASLFFLVLYLHALRSEAVPGSAVLIYVLTSIAVMVAMAASWSVSPIHRRETDNFLAPPVTAGVVVYCLSFWAYLAFALTLMAWTCFRRRRNLRHQDRPRSVSLLLSGAGALIGLPVVGAWSLSLVLIFNGQDGEDLRRMGDALLPFSAGLVGLGVISLFVVPLLVAAVIAIDRSRRLEPLWRDLVGRYPQVHLSVRPTGGPVGRLQFRVERMIIEIRDALRIAPAVRPELGMSSVDAVVQSIRSARAATAVHACDVLERPESREADIAQLIALAAAYRRSSDATA